MKGLNEEAQSTQFGRCYSGRGTNIKEVNPLCPFLILTRNYGTL
jgi:hypothetical protein